jgi:hypothetical protein
MQTLIHADMFFFISSIGFVLLWVLMAVALIYVIKLFRSVLRVTRIIERDVAAIGEDTKDLIRDLRKSRAFSFLFGTSKK